MDLLNKNGYNLRNLGKINIILGKNGCGKSTALKAIASALEAGPELTKYLSPERGGVLNYEPGVESNITQNGAAWANDQLRRNQYQQFKQQSVVQYRKLETLTLRAIEKDHALRQDLSYTFDTIVEKINSLLSNVAIQRTESGFKIMKKGTTDEINSANISSGESELVSLAIECLYFVRKSEPNHTNVLIIDEPDVHLHPDLQVKFAKFIKSAVEEANFNVIIATHSTAFLGALQAYNNARFAFMQNAQTDFTFREINEMYTRILPIFGAHPLSNLFNEAPIMLLEGEDDVRIWQQAIRTSQGRLKVFPCSVDTIDNLNQYEVEVRAMLQAVYDDAKGYSLRDRDADPEEINDLMPVIRMRLSCRNAENLILTDEVLATLGISWNDLQNRIQTWIESNPTHPKYAEMVAFRDGGYNRKDHQLKYVRNDLIGLAGSNKAWEIVVGQTIGRIKNGTLNIDYAEHKICNFLGEKLVMQIVAP
jgi:predicted ATPase